MNYISLNGESFSSEEKLFTIHNRGLRFGDGLFESIRMISGQPQFLDFHTERLQKGMRALKFLNWESFNKEFIQSEILSLARKNKIYKDARIRISVFRNDGGLYAPQKNTYSYLIEIYEMEEKGYEWNKKGLIIDVYDEVRKDFGMLSGFKTTNSLPYVLAGVYKNEKKVDECVLLNSAGNMVEAVTSNIFLAKKGELFTPSLEEGCIDGTMRKVIINLAEEKQIKVNQTKLNPALLTAADELFITNAVRGVQWIVGYGEKRYFSKLSKVLADSLSALTS